MGVLTIWFPAALYGNINEEHVDQQLDFGHHFRTNYISVYAHAYIYICDIYIYMHIQMHDKRNRKL